MTKEIIPYVITAAIIGIPICIMWIHAVKSWFRKVAMEEMSAIDDREKKPTAVAWKKYENYKDSFPIIARGWRRLAFEYAFRIGYSAGKEESENERIDSKKR